MTRARRPEDDARRRGAGGIDDGATLMVMRVWIDQDLCTGDGLCTDHAPDVFELLDDGISYVKEAGVVLNDPGCSGSVAVVPWRLTKAVINAAEDCPGECIFLEDD
jgi:ferredoxin